jgi:signal transduction histidine kinase
MSSEQPVNILLVDDRPENLLAMQALLQPLGHNLIAARSGEEALRCVLAHEFAVILLDVQMPGMDGFETAELIRGRERSQHIPLIFLTGVGTSELQITKGYLAGAVDYLLKPIVPEVLLSKVSVFVELYRKTVETRRQAAELQVAVDELHRARDELEARVRARTADLTAANEALRAEIAERQRLEAQLMQAQKIESIGRLAGGVAHDFNNLLTAIGGYAELALDALPVDHEVQDDLREIRKATARAAALTQQLLAFARKQIINPRVSDLATLTADVHKLLRRLIGENVQIVVRSEPNLGPVRVDAGQFEQLLMNLAINARDAMPAGGTLTIELANLDLEAEDVDGEELLPGPYVCIAVSDTGLGMDAHTQAHLFEPFFTTKEVGQGTGLGLATCYGIVKQHGGTIAFRSAPGQGTTFEIYLPRVDAELSERLEQEDLDQLPGGDERVLVVEDEAPVRELIARVLRALGYEVVAVADGTAALRAAEPRASGRFDLLLTDVVMPGIGGEELATRLRATHPAMRVMFISGYTESVAIANGRLEEEHAVLAKPFEAAALARKVREALDQ